MSDFHVQQQLMALGEHAMALPEACKSGDVARAHSDELLAALPVLRDSNMPWR